MLISAPEYLEHRQQSMKVTLKEDTKGPFLLTWINLNLTMDK